MKRSILSAFIALLCVSCYGQTGNNPKTQQDKMNIDEFSFESAHPKAQALMKDDFFWNSAEETSPFGNDDGWEASQGFKKWRTDHKTENPVIYLQELIEYWGGPYIDWNELDTSKVKGFVDSDTAPNLDEETINKKMEQLKQIMKSANGANGKTIDDKRLREIVITNSKSMAGRYLLSQDNAAIAIAFAQFALEGKVHDDLKQLSTSAIKRQLLQVLLNRYLPEHQAKRKEQLTKMLNVISKA